MSTIWDLSVTSTLLGTKVLPSWYLGAGHWAEGLGTAYFALIGACRMVCFGLAIVSTRRFPRWTGVVLLIAAATLFGQFAVFRGALPFPQFLAFIALGIAALVRPPAPASPRRAPYRPTWPPVTDLMALFLIALFWGIPWPHPSQTRTSSSTDTRLRRAARTGYRWLLLAFLVLGAVQIFLAGLGAFRIDNLGVSGDTAFAPHRAVGFAMGGVALFILILALIARPGVRAVIGSALLFLLAFLVQSLLASLADNTVWFGGLHALDGLAILGIAAFLYLAARRQHS